MMSKILITSGATRNPIDSMRCITANASGRTGVYIAKELNQQDVYLLGSPIACLRAQGIAPCRSFGSTTDLMNAMLSWIESNPRGIVIHSAAVGDFQVGKVNTGKISSDTKNLSIQLIPSPKILPKLKRLQPELFVVSFKAAAPETTTHDLELLAMKQRESSLSDVVFANVLGRIDRGILLLSRNGSAWYAHREQALEALVSIVREQCHLRA